MFSFMTSSRNSSFFFSLGFHTGVPTKYSDLASKHLLHFVGNCLCSCLRLYIFILYIFAATFADALLQTTVNVFF